MPVNSELQGYCPDNNPSDRLAKELVHRSNGGSQPQHSNGLGLRVQPQHSNGLGSRVHHQSGENRSDSQFEENRNHHSAEHSPPRGPTVERYTRHLQPSEETSSRGFGEIHNIRLSCSGSSEDNVTHQYYDAPHHNVVIPSDGFVNDQIHQHLLVEHQHSQGSYQHHQRHHSDETPFTLGSDENNLHRRRSISGNGHSKENAEYGRDHVKQETRASLETRARCLYQHAPREAREHQREVKEEEWLIFHDRFDIPTKEESMGGRVAERVKEVTKRTGATALGGLISMFQ